MKIAFRVDSSYFMGMGHVMRCLTLANALKMKGACCQFICRPYEGAMIEMIAEQGYGLSLLPTSNPNLTLSSKDPQHGLWLGEDWAVDAEQSIAVIGSCVDCLVVDHYGIDVRWEQKMRPICKQLVVLDDLADRSHCCDILLDPGIEAGLEKKYSGLTPQDCKLYVGPHFAILRTEFDLARDRMVPRVNGKIPERLVVMFGGNDQDHSTLKALKVISAVAPPGTSIDVVVSKANQNGHEIREYCTGKMDFEMHFDVDRVASLFQNADLAIASGGGATWERLYLQLPSLMKVIAENQRGPLSCMQELGLIELYENEEQLREKLITCFKHGVSLPKNVVSNGVPTLVNAILKPSLKLKKTIALDVRRTFHWLQDEELRDQFLLKDAPQRSKHFKYWRSCLTSEIDCFYSIYQEGCHIGNAGLKNFKKSNNEAELWFYIGCSENRSKGFGKQALAQLEMIMKTEFGVVRSVLHVSLQNKRALSLYKNSGYKANPNRSAGEAGFEINNDIICMEKTL